MLLEIMSRRTSSVSFRTVVTLRLNAALIFCGATALDHTLDEAGVLVIKLWE
jgi:hypothetical protein